jgi:hypothetical protein
MGHLQDRYKTVGTADGNDVLCASYRSIMGSSGSDSAGRGTNPNSNLLRVRSIGPAALIEKMYDWRLRAANPQ